MPYANDLVRVLSGEMPEARVPLWELHFHLWEQISGKRFISGSDYLALPPDSRSDALKRNADIMLEVADELHFAGITIPDSPWDCMYTLPFEARLELARLLSASAKDVLVVAGCSGVISMPGSSGYVEFCYRLMDAPEEIDEMCTKTYENGIRQAQELAQAGVRAIYTASDIADNRGPFFSPPQMQRYILPYLKKWTAEMKNIGILPILHTDGNITPVLEDLCACGIGALQALDPVAGMDIPTVKRAVQGRVALCGNVDCGMLITGQPDEIYADVCKLIGDSKVGGGFVLGASNAVVVETPVENYRAVVRAWEDCATY